MNRRHFFKLLAVGVASTYLRFRPESFNKLALDWPQDRFRSIRRTVFYAYPTNTAPLTGLLTLLKEDKSDLQDSWTIST